MIEAGAEKAASVAVTYGANKVCHLIPSTTAPAKAQEPKVIKADPQLQLDILREMGAMVEQGVDINTLFQMVLEGIHRGVGLDRVALCLIDPRVTQMTAKYVLGEDTEVWRANLQFPVKSEQDNLFAYCLHARRTVWMRQNAGSPVQHLIDKKTRHLVDADNLLIASVYANTRPIGLIVADRGWQGPAITQEQYESFEYFAQQTCNSLTLLASKHRDAPGS